jgi:hypothetical protein
MRFKEVFSLWLRAALRNWRDMHRTEQYCVVGVTLSLILVVFALVSR